MKHFADTVANQSNVLVSGASVSVFFTGTQSPAPLFSDDGITSKANPVITDSQGRFDFFVADGRYDIQVSGANISTFVLRNVEISDITEASPADALWATEVVNFANQAAPPVTPAAGTVDLYTLSSNKHLFIKDDTGAVTDLTVGTGGGGGGTLPGPPANSLQKNSGSASFVASGLIDNGSLISASEDLSFKGPNPYVDVRAFGVRSPSVIPQTTASIISGSSIATLAAASTFINGDGVVIYGAGATNTMLTPGAPVVTPSLAANVTGSGIVTNSPVGSTTYNYRIVARDFNGGLTAASPSTVNAAGQASLGPQTLGITSFSRTNNIITAQTATAHSLLGGALINVIVQSGQDPSFAGWFIVASAVDSTHFTYTCGTDTRNGGGTTTGAAGATVTWYNCNHISWAAVPGAFQYYIYGRTAGTYTLLGVSEPSSPNGGARLNWDDFGSPYMDGISLPAYVSNTAPTTATNDWLSTTIVSGAGTSTVTLANAALNTVSGATFLFDNAPGIIAATATQGLIYFPAGGTYVVNSSITLTRQVAISQAGAIVLNETLYTGANALTWYGDLSPRPWLLPSFGFTPAPPITVGTANPGIYCTNAGMVTFRGLNFTSAATNAARLLILDAFAFSTPIPGFAINDCSFTTGGNGDYISQHLIVRREQVGNTNESENFIRRTLFLSGVNVSPNLPTPVAILYVGITKIEDIFLAKRGVFIPVPFATTIDGVYNQGGTMPSFMVGSFNNNAPIGSTNISNVNLDTTGYLTANLSPNPGGTLVIRNSSASSGGATLVTGTPWSNVTAFGDSNFSGQNTNVSIFGSFAGGGITTTGGVIAASGVAGVGYAMRTPPAPTVTVGAHGSCTSNCVGSGTATYALVANDVIGGNTFQGPSTTVSIDGTQSVTVSWNPVPGQFTTNPGRAVNNGPTIAMSFGNGTGFGPTVTSYVDGTNTPVSPPGNFYSVSPPLTATALGTSLTSIGVLSGALTLTRTLFANLGTPIDGTFVYCVDCTIANPCAGSGTGALAKRLNGNWVCN